MSINENVTINANLTVKDANNNDVTVIVANAILDKATQGLTKVINVVNQDLLATNAASIKEQFDEFETAVKTRATELGFVIFTGGNN